MVPTDPDARAFAVPLGGSYYVYASHDRMLTAVGPVVVNDSKPTSTVNLVFPEGTTISGRVLGSDGRPMSGIEVRPRVSFFKHSWGFSTVTTGRNGHFSAGPINPDAGENSISIQPRSDYQPAYVKVLNVSKPVAIRLKRGFTARGVVRDKETG